MADHRYQIMTPFPYKKKFFEQRERKKNFSRITTKTSEREKKRFQYHNMIRRSIQCKDTRKRRRSREREKEKI
jgi:hypothetical protein